MYNSEVVFILSFFGGVLILICYKTINIQIKNYIKKTVTGTHFLLAKLGLTSQSYITYIDLASNRWTGNFMKVLKIFEVSPFPKQMFVSKLK